MLWLANHVMLQDVKTFSTDGTWVPEAAWSPASCVETAEMRQCLVTRRFLSAALQQNSLLQEYERRAQSQVKSLRDRRAEDAQYEDLLKAHNQDSEQDSADLAQKIQKVRSLWSRVEAVLSALQKERSVVESVLKGEGGQYVLDRRDMDLHIPPAMLRRVEDLQLQGDEEGQMNLLRMLELLTHALHLLREERDLASRRASLLHPRDFQEKSQEIARSLESLRLMRKKISLEEVPEVKSVIRMLEEDWGRRWAKTLKHHPLTSFLNANPGLMLFSLDNETLPAPSCENSLLSSEEEEEGEEEQEEGEEEEKEQEQEEEEEERELHLPHISSLRAGVAPVLLAAREHMDRLQQASTEASFTHGRKRAPEATPPLGDRLSEWLTDTPSETATTETRDKVFSLDPEALGSLSTPRREPFVLPTLITFSPLDDM